MTNPTPSLTDEQVAAIRARLDAIAHENDCQRSRFVMALWPSTRSTISVEDVAWLVTKARALLTDRDRLARELAEANERSEAVHAVHNEAVRLARRVEELEAALAEERARLVYDPSCESPRVALRQLDALRARILATVTEETPSPSPAQETP